MSNQDIFMWPGQKLADLVLSLFGHNMGSVDPELYQILAVILAIVTWLKLIQGCIALIKKSFGFQPKGY